MFSLRIEKKSGVSANAEAHADGLRSEIVMIDDDF